MDFGEGAHTVAEMHFDFSTADRIVFGVSVLDEVPKLISGFGTKAIVIHSPQATIENSITRMFNSTDKEFIKIAVNSEPTYTSIYNAIQLASSNNCDFVIGIGGGSVLDTAKVVAAMMTNGGELIDYLETVGKGLPIKNRCAPFLAIPTTAGTGSEVTRNAVIDIPEKKLKVSIRSALMLPWVSLIDPNLTISLPPDITAYTGMDAFVQVIEPYVSNRANVLVDTLCVNAIQKAAVHLRKVYNDGQNLESRIEMCYVSLMGGMCLANSGVGAVHGFAGAIGSMFHAAHGAVIASLVSAVMEVNISAIMKRDPHSKSLERYLEISKIITNNKFANYCDGIQWFRELCRELNIPRLQVLGIDRRDFPEIISLSKTTNSMKANPIKLSDDELIRILDLSY